MPIKAAASSESLFRNVNLDRELMVEVRKKHKRELSCRATKRGHYIGGSPLGVLYYTQKFIGHPGPANSINWRLTILILLQFFWFL